MAIVTDDDLYAESPPLSKIRDDIVNTHLAAVIPSSYPEEKFMKIVGPTFDLAATRKNFPTYTTCVALPGYIGARFGVYGLSGLSNIRTLGKAKGAWRYYLPGVSELPKPGDLYAVFHSSVSGPWDGLIVHVGAIVEVNGTLWKTADAGQGDAVKGEQRASYSTRTFYPETGKLSDGYNPYVLYPKPPKRLAGWLDVDIFFAK